MLEKKERPILFSGPMVRAILSSQKTVTRRVVKPQSAILTDEMARGLGVRPPAHENQAVIKCPYGQPGDRLWVRETWCGPVVDTDELDAKRADGWAQFRKPEYCQYRASGGCNEYFDESRDEAVARWRPSIHMPRWASRILLEITAVRVERLQDGDGETAFESRYLAEGINRIHHGDGEYYFHASQSEPGPGNWVDPFDAWRELWTGINGAESWAANPWVWVVEFKRVMQ